MPIANRAHFGSGRHSVDNTLARVDGMGTNAYQNQRAAWQEVDPQRDGMPVNLSHDWVLSAAVEFKCGLEQFPAVVQRKAQKTMQGIIGFRSQLDAFGRHSGVGNDFHRADVVVSCLASDSLCGHADAQGYPGESREHAEYPASIR